MAPVEKLTTLSGDEVEQLGLVKGTVDGKFRTIGYDLTIGQIVRSDGALVNEYRLPAQGIVEVISNERLEMPAEVYANVLIKTGLSNQGLLALGIGLVDPGYSGKLSSFIVNFSKDPQFLKAGDSFLRTVFYRVPESSRFKPHPVDDDKFVTDAQKRVTSNFSSSFLNIDNVSRRLTDQAIARYRDAALVWVPTIAIGLAIITFFLNFGSFAAMQRWFDPRVEVSVSEESDLIRKIESLQDRIEELEKPNLEADRPSEERESMAEQDATAR